jgi:protease I
VIHDKEPGVTVTPDLTLNQVDVDDYDALVLPGGVANPDAMRREQAAVQIVRGFFERGKVIAAICHAPWLLAEADVLRGRRVTSFESIRTDVRNAGADVADAEVVVDGRLITSRKPDDIPAFNAAIARSLEEALATEPA